MTLVDFPGLLPTDNADNTNDLKMGGAALFENLCMTVRAEINRHMRGAHPI